MNDLDFNFNKENHVPVAERKIDGQLHTDLTLIESQKIADIAAAYNITISDLIGRIIRVIGKVETIPIEQLTEYQIESIKKINEMCKDVGTRLSLIRFLRVSGLDPELFYNNVMSWIEKKFDGPAAADMMKAVYMDDCPYKSNLLTFIDKRDKRGEMPIRWMDEFALVRDWIIELRLLRAEVM